MSTYTQTLTYTGTLVVTTCWCGIGVAIPDSLYKEARDNGKDVYCPLGHIFVYRESEADKLRRQLKNANATAESERRWRETAERQVAAQKGVATKLRKRIHAGVCPFGCHRHFADLEAHVATKHPDQRLEGE